MAYETFRICRRSLNRNSFGHREYFLMNREGVTFKACRVYDLPINGEVQFYKDANGQYHFFAELGFEVAERLPQVAPPGVVGEVFLPPAVKTDVGAVEMA
jgi:hypothetical protein